MAPFIILALEVVVDAILLLELFVVVPCISSCSRVFLCQYKYQVIYLEFHMLQWVCQYILYLLSIIFFE